MSRDPQEAKRNFRLVETFPVPGFGLGTPGSSLVRPQAVRPYTSEDMYTWDPPGFVLRSQQQLPNRGYGYVPRLYCGPDIRYTRQTSTSAFPSVPTSFQNELFFPDSKLDFSEASSQERRTSTVRRMPIVETRTRKSKASSRPRIRSASLEDLHFESTLSPKGTEYEAVRIWKDVKGKKFYDCSCGRRKAIQDLKKIKAHAAKHFQEKQQTM